MSSMHRAFMCAVLTALIAVAIGPVGVAQAEPPALTIASPLEGSVDNSQTPSFSGSSNDALDDVTLNLYSGTSVDAGALVGTLTTLLPPLEGAWSVGPSEVLPAGVYTAQATQTNSLAETGSSQPPVTFTTGSAPVITSNPDDQTVLVGQPATFTASASGTPTPEVQWQVSTNGGSTWTNDTADSGNATGTLTIASTTTAESGQEYRAVFTNVDGTETSAAATLIVNAAPVVTTNPASEGIKVGASAMFTASASGAPAPTVQWQESKDLGKTWVNDTTDAGNTTGTLTVLGTTVAENGDEFRAVFTNVAGTVTSTAATLTVSEQEVAPVIMSDPVDQAVLAGEGVAFMASASGVPTPTVQWQVSTNDGVTWANDTTDVGNATGTLTILSAKVAESGREYRAVFTNSAGPAKTSMVAKLTVAKRAVAPVVTTNPSSKSVVMGDTTTFMAAASGVPTPEVQWQLSTDDGLTWANDITDAGNATDTLTVMGTTVAESGYEYRAVFANQAGTVTSSAVTLSVASPASLTPPAPPTTTPPTTPTPTPTPAPTPPAAAFTWVPAHPTTGQSVALVSSSTDADSPITAFAWDLTGGGTFTPGGPVITTSFSTPGNHTVRLRVTDANSLTSIATQTIAVSAAPLVLMQPFPVVRIAGSESASGVKISLLSVQAPVGTRVSVACGGRHCPSRSESRVVVASRSSKTGGVLLTFARFERSLHAGVMLEIRVSKPGEIGKYTSFRIRPNKPPARIDACVGPVDPKPIPCPTS